MTPVFTGDTLIEAKAVNPPLDKGVYQFEIGSITTFSRLKKDSGEEVYGLNVPLKVAEGDQKGKTTFLQLYFHTTGAVGMAKRFAMAAMGYKNDAAGERAYNEFVAAQPEEDVLIEFGVPGTKDEAKGMWAKLIGSTVMGDVDQQMGQNNEMQQNFKKWMPYASEA